MVADGIRRAGIGAIGEAIAIPQVHPSGDDEGRIVVVTLPGEDRPVVEALRDTI